MKNTKQIISVLLCVLMLASISVSAFAETTPAQNEKYPHFDSMFTIGDSNAMGYGLDGYYGNPHFATEGGGINDYTDFTYLHGTYGAYPQLVQEALGIERDKHDTMTYPALRTNEALHFLGSDFDISNDPFYTRPDFYSWWISPIVRDAGVDGQRFINEISEKPNDKKLILVYAGASDVFYSSIRETVNDFGTTDKDDILALAEQMWENYNKFLVNFPKLIEHIRSLNKDCTIVIVGTFNPMKDLKMSSDDILPAFEAVSAISGLMNTNYKYWANKYGCLYADISNVETATLEEGITYDSFTTSDPIRVYHATPEGYKYIARQILKALEINKPEVTKNIVVDLGSVKSINSVSVDGFPVKDYSFDVETHTLTVPYKYATAKHMTVTEQRGDGSVFAVTYILSYDGSTYHAYRTFATRNIYETFTNLFNLFRSLFRSIFSSIFG